MSCTYTQAPSHKPKANPYKTKTSMHMHTIAPLAEDRDPATQLAKEKQMSTKE